MKVVEDLPHQLLFLKCKCIYGQFASFYLAHMALMLKMHKSGRNVPIVSCMPPTNSKITSQIILTYIFKKNGIDINTFCLFIIFIWVISGRNYFYIDISYIWLHREEVFSHTLTHYHKAEPNTEQSQNENTNDERNDVNGSWNHE